VLHPGTAALLAPHAGRGDLIIDLAWSIDFFDILEWAHNNEALYVNASLESWHPSVEMHGKSSVEKSLYARYEKLLPLVAQCARPPRRSLTTAPTRGWCRIL